MMEYQQVKVLIQPHYQQALTIMLQSMRSFLTKNANPIKYYMPLSRIKIKKKYYIFFEAKLNYLYKLCFNFNNLIKQY